MVSKNTKYTYADKTVYIHIYIIYMYIYVITRCDICSKQST